MRSRAPTVSHASEQARRRDRRVSLPRERSTRCRAPLLAQGGAFADADAAAPVRANERSADAAAFVPSAVPARALVPSRSRTPARRQLRSER